MRLAIGIVLAAIAVAGNLAAYSSLDERVEVLQAAVEIPAGEVIEAAHLRVATVAVDAAVPVVSVDDSASVIGRYARSVITEGALIAPSAVADLPLVAPGAAVVSLRLPEGSIPDGLTERSDVLVVIAESDTSDRRSTDAPDPDVALDDADPLGSAIGGVVVGAVEAVGVGTMAVSVEVDLADAVRVARADQVRLVLIASGPDREEAS